MTKAEIIAMATEAGLNSYRIAPGGAGRRDGAGPARAGDQADGEAGRVAGGTRRVVGLTAKEWLK